MNTKKREQKLEPKRTREELAAYFMRLRIQESERKAQEYAQTLHPRAFTPD